jgi:hypothetical protein
LSRNIEPQRPRQAEGHPLLSIPRFLWAFGRIYVDAQRIRKAVAAVCDAKRAAIDQAKGVGGAEGGAEGGDGDGVGESFPRADWVAVPQALRARRVNRCGGRVTAITRLRCR